MLALGLVESRHTSTKYMHTSCIACSSTRPSASTSTPSPARPARRWPGGAARRPLGAAGHPAGARRDRRRAGLGAQRTARHPGHERARAGAVLTRAAVAGRRRDGPAPANTTRFLYLDPAARDFFVDYDLIAQDAAATLRLEAGRNPHDKDLITLVGELSTRAAVRAALGLAERQVPPQRAQAPAPPGRRSARSQLRGDGDRLRTGSAVEHLHRRPRHTDRGRPQAARQLERPGRS